MKFAPTRFSGYEMQVSIFACRHKKRWEPLVLVLQKSVCVLRICYYWKISFEGKMWVHNGFCLQILIVDGAAVAATNFKSYH